MFIKTRSFSALLTGITIFTLLLLPTAGSLAFTDIDTGEGAVKGSSAKMAAGAGVAIVPDYEGSDDMTAAPLLLFQSHYQSGRYVDLFGNRLRVNLLPNRTFHLGPVLQYRGERDDVDNNIVDKMEKVDAAVEAGAFAGFAINNWIASVQTAFDVSDAHDGSLTTLSGGYRFEASQTLSLVPTLSTTYADEDYMQTYFGVSAKDAALTGLPLYSADSGLKDVTAALIADYHPWEHWKLVGGAGYKKLLGDASDSPLVDSLGDDNQIFAGVMLAYVWGGAKPAPKKVAAKPQPKPEPVQEMVPAPKDSDGDGVMDSRDQCPNTPAGEYVDEKGCTLKLTLHINFDFDKADIKPEFKGDIDRAAMFIKRYPQVPYILLAGHTDSVGSSEYNKELSVKRANAVRQVLIEKHGIEAKRLFAKGFGMSQPVASNKTDEGRYQNRRVEVVCCVLPPLD